jgi:hypothetical protein
MWKKNIWLKDRQKKKQQKKLENLDQGPKMPQKVDIDIIIIS